MLTVQVSVWGCIWSLIQAFFSRLPGCYHGRRWLQGEDVSTHSQWEVRRSHCTQNPAGTLTAKHKQMPQFYRMTYKDCICPNSCQACNKQYIIVYLCCIFLDLSTTHVTVFLPCSTATRAECRWGALGCSTISASERDGLSSLTSCSTPPCTSPTHTWCAGQPSQVTHTHTHTLHLTPKHICRHLIVCLWPNEGNVDWAQPQFQLQFLHFNNNEMD